MRKRGGFGQCSLRRKQCQAGGFEGLRPFTAGLRPRELPYWYVVGINNPTERRNRLCARFGVGLRILGLWGFLRAVMRGHYATMNGLVSMYLTETMPGRIKIVC